MRASALLLAALVAGCGKTDTLSSSPTDAAVKTATFDPESPENTLAWSVGLYVKMGRTPKGNDLAAADAWTKYQEEANRHSAGKSVRWKFPVEKVDGNGNVHFAPIEMPAPHGLEPDQPKVFRMTLFPHAEPGQVVPTAFIFSSVPPKLDWLKTVRAGDRVLVVGVVGAGGSVVAEKNDKGVLIGRTGFSLKDGHVEAP